MISQRTEEIQLAFVYLKAIREPMRITGSINFLPTDLEKKKRDAMIESIVDTTIPRCNCLCVRERERGWGMAHFLASNGNSKGPIMTFAIAEWKADIWNGKKKRMERNKRENVSSQKMPLDPPSEKSRCTQMEPYHSFASQI